MALLDAFEAGVAEGRRAASEERDHGSHTLEKAGVLLLGPIGSSRSRAS